MKGKRGFTVCDGWMFCLEPRLQVQSIPPRSGGSQLRGERKAIGVGEGAANYNMVIH